MKRRFGRRARALFLAALGLAALVVKTIGGLQPIPDELPPLAAEVRQPRLTDRTGVPLSVTYENPWNVEVVPLHEIPELLRTAFIEAEDQRFFQHRGVDWLARAHAVVQNLAALEAVRGASTVTEQVVRLIHPRPRTLWSRWLEGFEAGRLESRFPKASLLEFYLNQVPYARKRRGVAQAAREYFDRDLGTLSVQEMLALVVLVRSPSRLDLRGGTELVRRPILALATRLREKGQLSPAELEAIRKEPLTVAAPCLPVEAAHFVRWVRRGLAEDPERRARVATTLDASLQERIQRILDQRVAKLRPRLVNAGAALALDHQTDEILAWVNAGGFQNPEGGQIDKVLLPRQPGSALKPFVYALALERGWSPATVIDDSPLADAVGSGLHQYRNYSRRHYGPVRLRDALGNSLNVPAIRAVQFTGRTALYERLRALGFESLSRHPDYYGDGLALGNGEVTLYDLVQAYAALARGGERHALRAVLLGGGKRDAPRRVFDAEVASLVADILSDPEARSLEFGRNSLLALPVATAIKTGTSTDYRDAWAVGFSHRFTVGVWMGNLDERPMHEVTGAIGPALVLRSIFAELHRNRESEPLYLSRTLTRVKICRASGKLPAPGCPTLDEWFRSKDVPKKPCPLHGLAVAASSRDSTADREARLLSPTPGLHLAMDPRIPDEMEAFPLKVTARPGFHKVEWWVDGELLATTPQDNTSYLWFLRRGRHEARARIWYAADGSPVETESVCFLVK